MDRFETLYYLYQVEKHAKAGKKYDRLAHLCQMEEMRKARKKALLAFQRKAFLEYRFLVKSPVELILQVLQIEEPQKAEFVRELEYLREGITYISDFKDYCEAHNIAL
ncbi:hypothetical protein A1D22_00760 [Pasteurellaceae bacterium LFhippo2]|nr:hypothetical protein [Pasteurellaceae bacterium LFhippo2]